MDSRGDRCGPRRRAALGHARAGRRGLGHGTARRVRTRDVTGLDAAAVIRTVPPNGSCDHEPNLFASVELEHPALPWLVSPGGSADRVAPWIVLIVVRDQPGVTPHDGRRIAPARADDRATCAGHRRASGSHPGLGVGARADHRRRRRGNGRRGSRAFGGRVAGTPDRAAQAVAAHRVHCVRGTGFRRERRRGAR